MFKYYPSSRSINIGGCFHLLIIKLIQHVGAFNLIILMRIFIFMLFLGIISMRWLSPRCAWSRISFGIILINDVFNHFPLQLGHWEINIIVIVNLDRTWPSFALINLFQPILGFILDVWVFISLNLRYDLLVDSSGCRSYVFFCNLLEANSILLMIFILIDLNGIILVWLCRSIKRGCL